MALTSMKSVAGVAHTSCTHDLMVQSGVHVPVIGIMDAVSIKDSRQCP